MLTGKMKVGEYTIEKRKATADSLDGNFITGPGILGHLFRKDNLEAIELQRILNSAFVAGWNARARDKGEEG